MKHIEVLILIETVNGGVIATPYEIPQKEPKRQRAIDLVEVRFAEIVREVSGEEISDSEMYDIIGDANYAYGDNCSVALHWDTVKFYGHG